MVMTLRNSVVGVRTDEATGPANPNLVSFTQDPNRFDPVRSNDPRTRLLKGANVDRSITILQRRSPVPRPQRRQDSFAQDEWSQDCCADRQDVSRRSRIRRKCYRYLPR